MLYVLTVLLQLALVAACSTVLCQHLICFIPCTCARPQTWLIINYKKMRSRDDATSMTCCNNVRYNGRQWWSSASNDVAPPSKIRFILKLPMTGSGAGWLTREDELVGGTLIGQWLCLWSKQDQKNYQCLCSCTVTFGWCFVLICTFVDTCQTNLNIVNLSFCS